MRTQIDWVSMTLQITDPLHIDEEGRVVRREIVLNEYEEKIFTWAENFTDWKLLGGRKPFAKLFHSKEGGMSVLCDDRHNFTLFEISGEGCDVLEEENALFGLLSHYRERLTRIDVACDILTDTKPSDFAELRDKTRFKSHSHAVSETGETFYIGSKNSDRYARVYRYNPPHDRAHLLRCEFVLRDENAKKLAGEVLERGLGRMAIALGNTFGFTHPAWGAVPDDREKFMSAPRERRDGATVRWLMKQVIPALENLYEEGNTEALQYFLSRATLIANGQHKEV